MDELATHGDAGNRLRRGEINPKKLLEFLHVSLKNKPLILLISIM